MELKKFVSETIKQITDGLIEGNDYLIEKAKDSEGIDSSYKKIHFDIAVTTNEGEKDNLGGGVFVAHIFKAGASSELTSVTSNTSRVQFDIFVHLKTKGIKKQ